MNSFDNVAYHVSLAALAIGLLLLWGRCLLV